MTNLTAFRRALETVLAEMLKELESKRFYRNGVYGYHSNPVPCDLNNGNCNEFARRVIEMAAAAPELQDAWITSIWLEEFTNFSDYFAETEWASHVVISLDGRVYDSECLDGVDDWINIPYAQRALSGHKSSALCTHPQ
jgi:hypothetical protein